MTYIKPQVLIHQEFEQSGDPEDTTLRAMIVGPNAILHRYSDAAEKEKIALGPYEDIPATAINFNALGLEAGGIVDPEYAKLYVENAKLCYYQNTESAHIASDSTEKPAIHSSVVERNLIITNTTLVETEGNPRDAELNSRDVQIGDYARVRAYVEDTPGKCKWREKVSKIIGYGYAPDPAVIGTPVNNGGASTETEGPTTTPKNSSPDVLALGTNSEYKAELSGVTDVLYTVTIQQIDRTQSCEEAIYIRYTSNTGESGYDIPVVVNEEFAIGSCGFTGVFSSSENLQVGNSWEITQKVAYEVPTISVTGKYTGTVNDIYYVDIVRGGTVGTRVDCPKAVIRTAQGREYIPAIDVTGAVIKTATGLEIQFTEAAVIRKGQTYAIPVTAAGAGRVISIYLQENLPVELLSSDEDNLIGLELYLYKEADLVLEAANEVDSLKKNFTLNLENANQTVTIDKSIRVYDDEIVTSSNEPKVVDLYSGNVYLEYREWSPTLVGQLNYCTSLADLNELIPGPLHPDNPLKYGVYKALSNSNGVAVGYTATATPDNLEDWTTALSVIEGESGVYSVTPLTQDLTVLNAVATMIKTESGAEQCRWKTGVFSLAQETRRMLVGQNTLNNDLFKTSEDGKPVMVSFQDNDPTDGYQFTVATIASEVAADTANAKFDDYGVTSGDELIVGDKTYIIDRVLNNDSVLLRSGLAIEDTEDLDEAQLAILQAPQKAEVWHNMTKLEQANYLGELAASFGDRRIMVVAPSKVGEAGVVLPGYYLAAAISGYKSGINAYQGMTRTSISGFDDFSQTKPYWSESQLNALASKGVCIVLEDANGTPYIRHALTTDMSDTFTQEEVITRDYDYICKQLYSVLDNYIGRMSVTTKTLDNIYTVIQSLLQDLTNRDYIRDFTDLSVKQHALLADRVEVTVTIVMPFPVNNIEVYVSAAKG